jgi:hypothetical protein
LNVNYKGYQCEVQFGQYFNGNVAIQLIGKVDTPYEDELITTASVNGELDTADDVVGLKTWSENEGIVQPLVDGNVIEVELLTSFPTGFVEIEYYRLTDAAAQVVKSLKEEF